MADTELKLKIWRGDQIGAERLAATILHLDGFLSVDPQCPLGGPDGLKDILCEKNTWKYVGAAYFPTADQKFKAVEVKFLHDLEGVAANNADGLVFLTNQALTPGERATLTKSATEKKLKSIIYHLERIRSLLDSPSGYGARLEFLDIEMSREEQMSFFSQWNRSFSEQLHEHGLIIIREISKKIDSMTASTEFIGQQIQEFSLAAQRTISALGAIVEKSDKSAIIPFDSGLATRNISIDTLCMLHRALMMDAPAGKQVGILRTAKVWIGGTGSPASATYVPPAPELVKDLLEVLLNKWRTEFAVIEQATNEEKISEIASFHHQFLKIHPFLDGNGRLARLLLMQQASELLNHHRKIVIEDRPPYFDALLQADQGNLSALESLITQAMYGVEFMPGSPCQMSGQTCPSCHVGVMDIDSTQKGVECNACGLFIPAE